jgi:predicted RNA-binding Zn-ribbon protein involved in translation (DUF1610 family)
VNPNNRNGLYLNISGLGFWITLLAIALLLSSVGLGWLVKSVAIFVLLLFLLPIIAYLIFRWWLSRNIVESSCPVCSTTSVSLRNSQFRCPGCGEALVAKDKEFVRYSPPGTVDVDAVDVSVKEIDTSSNE